MAKDLNVFDKEYGLLINGEWTKGSEGKLLSSYNPANGDELAKFTDATDADVDAAVAAAQEAFKTWRKTTTAERAAILNKIADVIDENAELFALQETLDNGKPIRETRAADVPLASDHFRYFASVIRGEEGTATQLDAEDLSIVLREPIGVVGQIIPWNFPFLMAAWKIAPALAAGCTIVIHPSSSTSLSLLSFAQKINHLLPKGVLNVITGRGSKSGEYMLHHKGFNKLAFTGSTEVGRRVGIAAAMTAGVFFTMSAMARRTNVNMNSLGRFLTVGAVVLMIAMIANFFLQIPALSLAVSAAFVLFSSLMIMWQVRTVIDGGEDSHISAALTIFISIYNIFSSLLRILLAFSGDD